jgi:hypothetical protein
MDTTICIQCKFYNPHIIKPSICTRISNINLITKKNEQFSLPASFKICKGYFFEKKKKKDASDMYIFDDNFLWVMCTDYDELY